jgi:hypothetical protein
MSAVTSVWGCLLVRGGAGAIGKSQVMGWTGRNSKDRTNAIDLGRAQAVDRGVETLRIVTGAHRGQTLARLLASRAQYPTSASGADSARSLLLGTDSKSRRRLGSTFPFPVRRPRSRTPGLRPPADWWGL